MEDNKQEQVEVETKEEVKEEQLETKVEEVKEDVKIEESKEEVKPNETDDKIKQLQEQLNSLLERDKQREAELQNAVLRNTIMEKVQDKDLQKAVLETGLVKNVEDIEKVMKIVELSKTLNKSKFTDGYKPQDEVTADAYAKAEQKGDILSMIKQKMNKQ
jgi:hypothetical protein